MPDRATSDDPAVQAQLDRLWALSPGADELGLERVTRLLARLGDPHRALPPVFHVAGTNGKGSTCAFLRAGLEAAGHRVHVYASPHLVRFNERIRLAGRLIDDAPLAALLAEVLDVGGDIGASFFEVTTAAAFLAFARTPADACVIEVGLGGRLDATNVIPAPAVCGIAQLGVDHERFLGDTPEAIAGEKAGIAKPGVPLVTMAYSPGVAARVASVAAERGATVHACGSAWRFTADGGGMRYRDIAGVIATPPPALPGAHQPANLALAIAMLRHQRAIAVPTAALSQAARAARWPARMQQLDPAGPLARLAKGAEVWIDGGHNAAAAEAVAAAIAPIAAGRPLHIVAGALANKDVAGLLAPVLARADRLIAVPIPGHEHHPPAAIAATAVAAGVSADTAADVAGALRRLASDRHGAAPVILILGSLYLAGQVLRANDEWPS